MLTSSYFKVFGPPSFNGYPHTVKIKLIHRPIINKFNFCPRTAKLDQPGLINAVLLLHLPTVLPRNSSGA